MRQKHKILDSTFPLVNFRILEERDYIKGRDTARSYETEREKIEEIDAVAWLCDN